MTMDHGQDEGDGRLLLLFSSETNNRGGTGKNDKTNLIVHVTMTRIKM